MPRSSASRFAARYAACLAKATARTSFTPPFDSAAPAGALSAPTTTAPVAATLSVPTTAAPVAAALPVSTTAAPVAAALSDPVTVHITPITTVPKCMGAGKGKGNGSITTARKAGAVAPVALVTPVVTVPPPPTLQHRQFKPFSAYPLEDTTESRCGFKNCKASGEHGCCTNAPIGWWKKSSGNVVICEDQLHQKLENEKAIEEWIEPPKVCVYVKSGQCFQTNCSPDTYTRTGSGNWMCPPCKAYMDSYNVPSSSSFTLADWVRP